LRGQLLLSDRRQQVLSALIEEYIEYALPVGSRTLVDRYHLGVSPATVRNELSVLEDEGYIKQPHTSAGRIPTDSGYRAFVDDLLISRLDQENVSSEMVDKLRTSASELDTLLEQTSQALSRLTDCLSVVMAPTDVAQHIKQVALVSGVSSLLSKPEFSHSTSLIPIMQVLENETILLHIFDERPGNEDTMVRIGRENAAEQFSGVSVVARQYGEGDNAGIVAVIGPTRMDYTKSIQAVRAAGEILRDF